MLLLPHGFEGMGPEHSSAPLERFLMLAAEDNIQVVQPTTPAQYFHLLRRQVLRPWRKPLVVMTPKSLLRRPTCVSTLDDLANGGFQRVIADARGTRRGQGEGDRVLLAARCTTSWPQSATGSAGDDVAIVRLEQLYPLPAKLLEAALAPYPTARRCAGSRKSRRTWAPGRFLRLRFGERLLGRLPARGVCRPESAQPGDRSSASPPARAADS